MTIEQTREKILNDDDFVISEIRKLQEVYTLKHEIRYAQSREDKDLTESVAEHIFGMTVIAPYFLKLEDVEQVWDIEKILTTITWHDLDEIIVGDIVSFDKITSPLEDESAAQKEGIQKLPYILQSEVSKLLEEYNERTTPEAKFVKAIDKIEGYIQMYQPGFETVLHSFGRHASHSDAVIGKHVEKFPYIKRFYEVLDHKFVAEGFFVNVQ